MYTYDLIIFGHRLNDEPELNKIIGENDLVFEFDKYEVETQYHGNSIDYVISFGIEITDTDCSNPFYIDKIRNFKEEDYIKDYNIFIEKYIESLNEIKEDEEILEIEKVINFLKTNKPKLYSLQVSS